MLQLVAQQERCIVWPGCRSRVQRVAECARVVTGCGRFQRPPISAAASAIVVCCSRCDPNCLYPGRRVARARATKPTVKPTPVKSDRRCRRSEHSDAWPDEADDSGADGGSHDNRDAGRPVPIGAGLTVSLGPVTKTTSRATNCAGTHVFYGPAIQFTLTFSQPTDLNNATLNVAFGSSATPADACDAPTGAGSASSFTYVEGIPKNLPSDQQSTVTIDFLPPNSAKDYQFKNVTVN